MNPPADNHFIGQIQIKIQANKQKETSRRFWIIKKTGGGGIQRMNTRREKEASGDFLRFSISDRFTYFLDSNLRSM